MLIDVYDFDGTIYDGDSTADFVLYCLPRHPELIAGLPRIALAALKLALKKYNLTQFKTVLFGEMSKRFSLEQEADAFWQNEKTRAKLGAWFYETPRDLPIVIASASPEFELKHAAKILGVEGGSLAAGSAADLVIVDPERKITVNANQFASKGRNTPFAGCKVRGKVKYTIVKGEVIFEEK